MKTQNTPGYWYEPITKEEEQSLLALIKKANPDCKAKTLYEACKNANEFAFRKIVRMLTKGEA